MIGKDFRTHLLTANAMGCLTFLRQKRDETQRLARITRVNLGIPSVQSVPPARRE